MYLINVQNYDVAQLKIFLFHPLISKVGKVT